MFYVYVLRSESDSGFYIGFSTNLRTRLRQHQNGESFATSHRGPWKLIYYEAYTEREDAEGREKFLKDLAQCVRGTRVVQIDGRRKTIRDATGIREKFAPARSSFRICSRS